MIDNFANSSPESLRRVVELAGAEAAQKLQVLEGDNAVARYREVMGATNYGFATVIGNHTGISTTGITSLGNAEQKQRFLPKMASGEWVGAFALTEPQAGSEPASMRTMAVKKGDRYVLNGEKIYITNAGPAHVFTVMAITDKSKGIKGISAFVVERNTPGFSVGKNELKMGMHGCTTAPLSFTDCEVPAENLLGAEGMGYVQAMKTLTAGRVTVSARCCGMMDKLIERCVRQHFSVAQVPRATQIKRGEIQLHTGSINNFQRLGNNFWPNSIATNYGNTMSLFRRRIHRYPS
mgnify:CR=1 FL=1